jgi:hypothetical protein
MVQILAARAVGWSAPVVEAIASAVSGAAPASALIIAVGRAVAVRKAPLGRAVCRELIVATTATNLNFAAPTAPKAPAEQVETAGAIRRIRLVVAAVEVAATMAAAVAAEGPIYRASQGPAVAQAADHRTSRPARGA